MNYSVWEKGKLAFVGGLHSGTAKTILAQAELSQCPVVCATTATPFPGMEKALDAAGFTKLATGPRADGYDSGICTLWVKTFKVKPPASGIVEKMKTLMVGGREWVPPANTYSCGVSKDIILKGNDGKCMSISKKHKGKEGAFEIEDTGWYVLHGKLAK